MSGTLLRSGRVRPATVLVTGASGFVGRHVVATLRARGHDVLAPDRHTLDLFNGSAVRRWMERARPSGLIHLAWCTDPADYRHSPLNQSWLDVSTLLHGLFCANGGVRAVFAGSCAEYDWSAGVCSEDTPCVSPGDAYTRAKIALGQQVLGTPNTVWARLFFLLGPGESGGRLVPSLAAALARGERGEIGPGHLRRDFLDVRDASRALVDLFECEFEGTVNVGSGAALAVADVALAVGRLLGATERVGIGERAAPVDATPLVLADIRRLVAATGFAPRYTLDETLLAALTPDLNHA